MQRTLTPLGKALKIARLKTDTLQKQLALFCNYPFSSLSNIERGERMPPKNFNEKAKAFFKQYGLEVDFSREIAMSKPTVNVNKLPPKTQDIVRRLAVLDLGKVQGGTYAQLTQLVGEIEREIFNER